jgi:hypothetical protein
VNRIPLHLRTAALLLVVLTCASCNEDELLDLEPPGRYTPDNFYQTEDQIRDATITLYPLARGLFVDEIVNYGELRSDNTTFEYNEDDRGRVRFEEIDYFLLTASSPLHGNLYGPLYTGILRANYILARIDEVAFEDEALREQRRGEALFFRGFYHYLLTLHFGPVVPQTAPVEDDGSSLIGLQRQPVETVYSQVVLPDLQGAIDRLPESWPSEQVGRVTRGAAQMAMAKAHFARRDFSAALPFLNDLVSSNTYQLMDDFKSVFTVDNNPEIIYSAQFDAGVGQGANWMFDWIPRSGTDITQGRERPATGFNIPTSSLVEAFEEGDERFEVTIGFYDSDPNDATNEIIPYSRKFLTLPFPQEGGIDVDYPIFRYADALLMQAEALVETEGGLPNRAFENINRLRARAGLPFFFPGNPDSTLNIQTTEDLSNAIRQERRVELAYEGSRTYDLRRYGTFVETMLAHGRVQKEKQSFLDEIPEAYTEIRPLLAIPQRQVELYGYEQNSGWE